MSERIPALPEPIRLPSVLECVNMDNAKVPFVKNKNKSGGARRAGSGTRRPGPIPAPGPKQTERVKRQQPPPPPRPRGGRLKLARALQGMIT